MATRFDKHDAAARGYTKADWDAVSDIPTITKARAATGKSLKDALPDIHESIQRSRGRPKLENAKAAVTLRLDPATLARFQASGKDWRKRMATILDDAV